MAADITAPNLGVELAMLTPMFIVLAGAVLVAAADVVLRRPAPRLLAAISFASIAAAAGWLIFGMTSDDPVLGGAILPDGLARAGGLIALTAAGLTVMLGVRSRLQPGEYYALILVAAAGMMFIPAAADFLTLVVSLEIVSVATFLLVGGERSGLRSGEAALKYFILSGFSGAFLLLGIAFLYGATGSLDIAALASPDVYGPAFHVPALRAIGAALLLTGLGFKASVAPFHLWAPDVYQGASTPIAGLLATGVKAAAVIAALRVLAADLLAHGDAWKVLWAAAALTMVLGNLVAIVQTSVKRMLAYSSIAHTGYVLTALAPLAQGGARYEAFRAAAVYLLIYSMTTVGAFAVLTLRRSDGREIETLEDLRGLYRRRPAAAAAMSLFMFSLAGLPPLAGFWAKYFVFSEAVNAGFYGLAVIGVLASAASLYYYVRVIVAMVSSDGDPDARPETAGWGTGAVIAVAVAAVLLLGVYVERLQQILTGL
jgi:NADH-quinone oxidoreductase subunit N